MSEVRMNRAQRRAYRRAYGKKVAAGICTVAMLTSGTVFPQQYSYIGGNITAYASEVAIPADAVEVDFSTLAIENQKLVYNITESGTYYIKGSNLRNEVRVPAQIHVAEGIKDVEIYMDGLDIENPGSSNIPTASSWVPEEVLIPFKIDGRTSLHLLDENNINISGYYTEAVVIGSSGELSIDGDGTFNVKGGTYEDSIDAYGDIIINSGNVNVITAKDALRSIYVRNGVGFEIHGGTVKYGKMDVGYKSHLLIDGGMVTGDSISFASQTISVLRGGYITGTIYKFNDSSVVKDNDTSYNNKNVEGENVTTNICASIPDYKNAKIVGITTYTYADSLYSDVKSYSVNDMSTDADGNVYIAAPGVDTSYADKYMDVVVEDSEGTKHLYSGAYNASSASSLTEKTIAHKVIYNDQNGNEISRAYTADGEVAAWPAEPLDMEYDYNSDDLYVTPEASEDTIKIINVSARKWNVILNGSAFDEGTKSIQVDHDSIINQEIAGVDNVRVYDEIGSEFKEKRVRRSTVLSVENTYTVKYEDENGAPFIDDKDVTWEDKAMNEGSKLILPTENDKYTYEITDKATGELIQSGIAVTGDMTVVVKKTLKEYTVTYIGEKNETITGLHYGDELPHINDDGYIIVHSDGSKTSGTVSGSDTYTVIKGTKDLEECYMSIADGDDLRAFRDYVNNGYTRLNANLSDDVDVSVDNWTPIQGYKGIFNGQNHRITYNIVGNIVAGVASEGNALFTTSNGATIKNLNTSGSIKGGKYSSGIVGTVKSMTTISNCTSDVDITYVNDTETDVTAGGMVGKADRYVDVYDCMFTGSMRLTDTAGTARTGLTGQGGIVGWSSSSDYVTMINCIVDADFDETASEWGEVFVRNGYNSSSINMYYLKDYTESLSGLQGEKLDASTASGRELPWKMNTVSIGTRKGNSMIWTQGTTYPVKADAEHGAMCRVGVTVSEGNVEYQYIAAGENVVLPDREDPAGHVFEGWFAGDKRIASDTPVDNDMTLTARYEDDHSWDAGVVTTAPTCTEKGVRTYTCSLCGKTKTEEIPATGHQHTELRNAKAATCTEAGYTGDTYCTDCNTVVTAGKEIPATGHQHTELRNVKAATCTEAGYTGDTYCTDCNTVVTAGKEIPATGHQHTEIRNVKAATCTEAGYTGDTYCTDCNTVVTAGKEIPATGHQHTEIRNAKAATCTEAGYTGDTYCTDCNTVVTAGKEIPATGHQHTELRNVKAATCTEAGYTGDTYCTDCNTVVTAGKEIAATGHQHTEIKNVKAATCTEAGYTGDTYCTDCGTLVTKGEEIAATGHTVKTTVKKATFSSNGYILKKCSVCGEQISKTGIYKIKSATLDDTVFKYDGKTKKPKCIVKDSKNKVVSSKYYTVAYADNKKAGIGTATITFKGNYSGTVTKYFTIQPQQTKITYVKGSKKSFTVKWKKQACSYYKITYVCGKTKKTATITNKDTTYKKFTGLKPGSTCKVSITAYYKVKVNNKTVTYTSVPGSYKTVKVAK